MEKILLILSLLFVSLICISEPHITYDDCSVLPGVVCTPFKAAFSRELAESRELLHQFDVTLTPNQASHAFFNDTLKFFTILGASNPLLVATKLASAARCKFEGITPNEFAAMCAKAVERFLKKEGLITKENAASLAKNYVKFLNVARLQPGFDGSSYSNLFSLCDATTNLLFDVTDLTPKKADIFGAIAIKSYASLPCHCG